MVGHVDKLFSVYGEGNLLRGSVDILAANPEIFPKMQAILSEEREKAR